MGELLILLQTFHAQWILKRSIKITARVENTKKVSILSENVRLHLLALVRKMRTLLIMTSENLSTRACYKTIRARKTKRCKLTSSVFCINLLCKV